MFKGATIVYRSPEEIREMIIEHLTRTGVIPTTANHNWRVEPEEAVEALRRLAEAQQDRAASNRYVPPDGMPARQSNVAAAARPANVALMPVPAHSFAARAGNSLTQ